MLFLNWAFFIFKHALSVFNGNVVDGNKALIETKITAIFRKSVFNYLYTQCWFLTKRYLPLFQLYYCHFPVERFKKVIHEKYRRNCFLVKFSRFSTIVLPILLMIFTNSVWVTGFVVVVKNQKCCFQLQMTLEFTTCRPVNHYQRSVLLILVCFL